MTIRLDITHVDVKKEVPAEPEKLFIRMGNEVYALHPGEAGTFYVHRAQDVHVFYERRRVQRRSDRRRINDGLGANPIAANPSDRTRGER